MLRLPFTEELILFPRSLDRSAVSKLKVESFDWWAVEETGLRAWYLQKRFKQRFQCVAPKYAWTYADETFPSAIKLFLRAIKACGVKPHSDKNHGGPYCVIWFDISSPSIRAYCRVATSRNGMTDVLMQEITANVLTERGRHVDKTVVQNVARLDDAICRMLKLCGADTRAGLRVN